MITSNKQYATGKKKLAMLEESLAEAKEQPINSVPDIIRETNEGQLQSLIDEIRAEIEEHEKLKSAKLKELKIHSIHDLMVTPIRYRIASHMSVEDFGRKVGVSERQIHRYEAENYSNANTSTLIKILEKLDVTLDGHIAESMKDSI